MMIVYSATSASLLIALHLICSPALGDVLLMTANPDHGIYHAEPGGNGSYIGTTFTATPIPSGGGYPYAMAFDDRSGLLYWTDRNKLQISRARLNGSDYSVLVSQDSITLRGIAVDPVNNRVLWCDPGKPQIEFIDLDGSNRGVLIDSDIIYPNDIVVTIKGDKGYIIWCDSTLAKIERMNIDGTGRKTIQSGLADLSSLALDYSNGRLYWSDRELNRIESIDLKGNDRRVHVTAVEGESSYDPYVVALRGENSDIYFTDYTHKKVYWLSGSSAQTVAWPLVSSSALLPHAPRCLLFIQDSVSTTTQLTLTEPSTTTPAASTTDDTSTTDSSSTMDASSYSETAGPPSMNSRVNSKLFIARGLPDTNFCMRDHVILTTHATTGTQCAMICSLHHDCLSFNFYRGSNLCELNDGKKADVSVTALDASESDCRYFELRN